MKRILLIEDEPGLVLTLSDRLKSEGFETDTASDGVAGLTKATASSYDAIILDVMLPQKNGFDVCRDLRTAGNTTPILMLTARGQITDKVVGLKLGADDYLTKPFDMSELLARVEALLRRAPNSKTPSGEGFTFGNVEVNFRKAEIKKDGQLIELSAQEYRLLKYMIENRGATLTRNELLEHVWSYDENITTRTVDVHIAWLRQKLEPNSKHPQYFVTIHRLGYKFTG
ncbi:response regulator transcription factor [bacterium]|nr:response regulator transcription factor [bacterium]